MLPWAAQLVSGSLMGLWRASDSFEVSKKGAQSMGTGARLQSLNLGAVAY